MIDVKEAVSNSIAAAKEFYAGTDVRNIMLEEVELDEGEKVWLITLGFFLPESRPATEIGQLLAPLGGIKYEKKYKIFKVNAENGKVESMKIREI